MKKNVLAVGLISCQIKMVVVPTVDTILRLIIQNGDLCSSLNVSRAIKSSKERKVKRMLKKIGGVILVIVGLFFSIATVKMLFVDLPKAKSSMKDAVYVGEDAIDKKNDGKIVIVCGEFELTQPSYDEELGISFDTIRAARTKQTLERTKNTASLTEAEKENMTAEEKLYGILEWNTGLSEDITLGEGKIGNYTLSPDFIQTIHLDNVWDKYDEESLEALGYAYMPDDSFSQEHFIEPLDQSQRNLKKNDVRYFYYAADLEPGQVMTAIGIQDGQVLKAAPKISDNLIKGVLDKETAAKQGGSVGIGVILFSIVLSLGCLLAGIGLVVAKKD